MDFLPKPSNRSEAAHGAPIKSPRPRGVEEAAVLPASNLKSNPALARLVRNPLRAWIVFTPSVLLIICLIAAFRSGGLAGKPCAIAIGLVLTVHNVGSFVQKILDKTLPGISGVSQVARGAMPLLALFGFLVWLQPSTVLGFYDETIRLGSGVVGFVIASRLVATWFLGRFGRSWSIALQLACCFYLAVLYVVTFVIKVPSLAYSLEGIVALAVGLAVLLHLWSDDLSTMAIQVASVTYTLALWDTQADVARMANTLYVSFTLLALLIAIAVAANGFLRIGKK
jgi:hypothetical protein